MKTLAEHNKGRMEIHNHLVQDMQPHANGIACPKCGLEMWDSNPMETLTNFPPLKNVHCQACGHRDLRLA